VAARRGRRQAEVVAAVTRPDPLEATVAGHTARHLTATTYCQPGRSNTDAAQLIESLHTRAQHRAERPVSVPTRAITTTQPARREIA
jgi:hypothetical protein